MPREEFAGRYISVYFDTVEEKLFREGVAREHGTTLSKLVFEGLETLRPRVEAGPRIFVLRCTRPLGEKGRWALGVRLDLVNRR